MSDQPRMTGASPDSAMQSTEAESPALTTWRAGSRRSRGGATKIGLHVQGDQGGLTQDVVDFDSGVVPFCTFAMPSLPNFHLPKQNWADSARNSKGIL